MRLSEILQRNPNPFSAKLTDTWVDRSETDADRIYWEFDLFYRDKKIGTLTMDDYFGQLWGDFGARTVDIGNYADWQIGREENPEEYVTSALNTYFLSKTGQKHFDIMFRQQGLKEQSPEKERCSTCDGLGKELVGDDQLVFDCPDCKGTGYFGKEELEEIKVTKTLAGKKQTPSRQLAMDKKKKSPKQGKKPVEPDKAAKSMKDLSNEILKGEYTNTRDFARD